MSFYTFYDLWRCAHGNCALVVLSILASWKNRLQHFEFSICGSWKRVCLSPLCHWCWPFLGNFTFFAILQWATFHLLSSFPWSSFLKRTTPGWVNEKGDSFILVRKSTRTLGLLVGAFATAHLPFLVFHALDGAFEEKLPHRLYVGSVVKCLTFTTSTLNWALYGFLNREY